jgi:predicted dinucleotide-binding enzyme
VRISVLGTGSVGRALAGRLAGLGHDVVVGTRDPGATLARTEPDVQGTPPYAQWQEQHSDVRLVPLPEAGAHAEVLVNATAGAASADALAAAQVGERDGLVVLDVANPLVFTADGPALSVANTDSLAETLQRAFPQVRVVKALNTMNAEVMVHPDRVPGDHVVFVAGGDAEAKATVSALLGEFGWGPVGSSTSADWWRRVGRRASCCSGGRSRRPTGPTTSTSRCSDADRGHRVPRTRCTTSSATATSPAGLRSGKSKTPRMSCRG